MFLPSENKNTLQDPRCSERVRHAAEEPGRLPVRRGQEATINT